MRGGLPPRKLDRLAMVSWANTIWNRAPLWPRAEPRPCAGVDAACVAAHARPEL